MKILGIETSCDETAAGIVENGTKILSNAVVSQIDIHKIYGGVVPEIAARSHIEAILPVINQSLVTARLHWPQIDAIAVTHTPGLLGSLLIGTLTARTLAILHHKPLYPTHHLKSHIYANWLTNDRSGKVGTFSEHSVSPVKKSGLPNSDKLSERSEFLDEFDAKKTFLPTRANGRSEKVPTLPLVALVVSGGHTQLIYMTGHNHFEIIGTTKDDAVGEVFDKIAKILGLPYPGGPSISAAATTGDPHKYSLPHPKMPGLDFSFSGLKTAVLRAVQKELGLPISTPSTQLASKLSAQQIADFAASFQNTAVDILIEKLSQSVDNYQPKSILLAGGVAANSLLRNKAESKIVEWNSLKRVVSPVKNTAITGESEGRVTKWDPPEANQNDCSIFDQCEQTVVSENSIRLFCPPPKFSTDNAVMVASAAYFAIQAGEQPTDPYALDISPRSLIA